MKTKRKQSLREYLGWKIAYGLKPLYFAMRKKRIPWKTTMEDLQWMPDGSLGNDLWRFLRKHKLKLIPRAEFHDVYHVLFQYGTCIRDEACVQFVPLGNGRFSLPYIACTVVSAVFFPEHWGHFYKAFMKGKNAMRFHDLDFEKLLHVQTETLRRIILSGKVATQSYYVPA